MSKTVNYNNTNIWESIGLIAHNILAHVNITFDGATGSFHIDIVPSADKMAIVESSPAITIQTESMQAQLPDNTKTDKENGEKEGSTENVPQNQKLLENQADNR